MANPRKNSIDDAQQDVVESLKEVSDILSEDSFAILHNLVDKQIEMASQKPNSQ